MLLETLAAHHPLPDGNKRTAFAMTIDFLEQNGRSWADPNVATDAELVGRVAAGDAELEEIVGWIKQRTTAAS